ncbi:MAG: 5'/3'-nucleotidase SurE [Treponema sp.]|nr:5'/3'-nucleotidase SurE [Treponema sp.]
MSTAEPAVKTSAAGDGARRRKLLLTNDDGISAPGLLALEKALSKVADVFVLAPDANRSGVSNLISMDMPLTAAALSPRRFSYSGSPVDCVIAGLHSDLFSQAGQTAPFVFDAVFSGINRGPNMGTDLVYSGTVAAARQAVLYGVPGFSLSLSSGDGTWKFEALAAFAAKNLEPLLAFSALSPASFVNVNADSRDFYEKVVYSSLCRRDYHDTVAVSEKPASFWQTSFVGGCIQSHGGADCDYESVIAGNVAVSLIRAEPVAEPVPASFSSFFQL